VSPRTTKLGIGYCSITMGFVIKANASERAGWLTTANDRGFRYLADRAQAALFPTRAEAQEVIETLPKAFESAGILFSIEPARSRLNEPK
jgi:hypothetical protein